MDLVTRIRDRARQAQKTIVLPESEDPRVLTAAELAVEAQLARVVLLGDRSAVAARAKEHGVNLGGISIINPPEAAARSDYIRALHELRKHKGMTQEQAQALAAVSYTHLTLPTIYSV